MSTLVTSRAVPTLAARDPADDPFHDPLLIGIGVMFIVVTVVILALGGLYYWGALYGSPSWSANSFPPPIPH
jgi:hypothetical protein